MSWQHFVRSDGAPLRQLPLESTSVRTWEREVYYDVPDIGMCEMPVAHWLSVVDIHHLTNNAVLDEQLM